MSNPRRIRNHIVKLVLLALMFCTAIPTAWPLQGEELANLCSDDKDKFKQGFCVGYLTGVSETVTGVLKTSGICAPKELTFEKLIAAVATYSSNHEEKRRGPAVGLVWSALVEAWPCPGMKTPEPAGGGAKPR